MFNVEPPTLVAVLDGLGGHPAGDIAAALAAEVIAQGSSEVKTEQDVIGRWRVTTKPQVTGMPAKGFDTVKAL